MVSRGRGVCVAMSGAHRIRGLCVYKDHGEKCEGPHEGYACEDTIVFFAEVVGDCSL